MTAANRSVSDFDCHSLRNEGLKSMRRLNLYELLIGIVGLILSISSIVNIANGNSSVVDYVAIVAFAAVFAILAWRIFNRRKTS